MPYEEVDGFQPFSDWLDSISDVNTRGRIDARIRKMEQGGLGDHWHLGEGVYEARFDFGPGWRVYFGFDRERIILLHGGTKKRQQGIIDKAKLFWTNYRQLKGVQRGKEKT
ncbi:MAG TPA: type II toxin-antitoxin system RelE/ParE family toxin [Bdellovibrionota bacterium]|nr:type II toxin-antitoxin system RelE/ParE family toxin [Bdellovibrionota bacterium]